MGVDCVVLLLSPVLISQRIEAVIGLQHRDALRAQQERAHRCIVGSSACQCVCVCGGGGGGGGGGLGWRTTSAARWVGGVG